jgi:hypothetical protein
MNKGGMSRKRNMPNPENCTLEELEVEAKASKVQRTYVRLKAIKAFIYGIYSPASGGPIRCQ